LGINQAFSKQTAQTSQEASAQSFRVNTTTTTCTPQTFERRGLSQVLLAAAMLLLFPGATPALRAQQAAASTPQYSSSAQGAPVDLASNNIEEAFPAAPEADSVRSVPAANIAGAAPTTEAGPFRSWRLDVMANSLGAGFEVSTPIARHFDVRGGANITSFGYEFDVDGLHYDSRIMLRSGNLRLDWFPLHRNFHISSGILYANNYVDAPSHVPAGAKFTLGDENFVNSVDDPVHGHASLVFPRRVSPLLTAGFRNILPGQHRHIAVPLEFGVAFTGSPKIDVSLAGRACQTDGCFNFEDEEEAQQSLRDEIRDINNTLSSVPVYPIISLGFGYRF
jgi:hypothetical protein